MAGNVKQDSNLTGLRIAREASPNVLGGSPVWHEFAPNSYRDFGADYKKVARQPINRNRQRKKGVVVDLDSSGGFQADVTDESMQAVMEGVLMANFRTKSEKTVATVDADDGYTITGGGYAAGDLLFAKFFTNPLNNGLKLVTAATATLVDAAGLADAAGQVGVISRVGFEFAAADATIDVAGAFPALVTTTKVLTDLGLTPGEWVFLGGDAAGNKFAQANNNGFARVRSIAAKRIEFDKSENPMVGDAGTGKTIRMFFGRVVRNELFDNLVQHTFQMERTLGKEDTTDANEQAEYVTGVSYDEMTITLNTADKATFEVTGVGSRYETITDDEPLKAGARPTLIEGNAYNTTSNVRAIGLNIVNEYDPLFAYVTEASIMINNNVRQNKAIGVMGSFSSTLGILEVSASMQAYFSTLKAVAAIRNNEDVTLHALLAQDNRGMAIDLPLVSLGDGRLRVQLNEPITLPLGIDAADAADLGVPGLDMSIIMSFFDYLPDAAMPVV